MAIGKKLSLSWLVRVLRLSCLFPDGRRWKRECPGCGVLNYAGCFGEAAGSVDRVNGWEAGLHNELAYIHNLLYFIAVLARAGTIPSCDTTRKNAFYGVKVGESHS